MSALTTIGAHQPLAGPAIARARRVIRRLGSVVAQSAMIGAPVHCAPVAVRHDINTAVDGDLVRIPGVGKVLLNALIDGRPWSCRAHFREGIGRHVDPDVLDLLEAYLVIPADPIPMASERAPASPDRSPAPVRGSSTLPVSPPRWGIAAGSPA